MVGLRSHDAIMHPRCACIAKPLTTGSEQGTCNRFPGSDNVPLIEDTLGNAYRVLLDVDGFRGAMRSFWTLQFSWSRAEEVAQRFQAHHVSCTLSNQIVDHHANHSIGSQEGISAPIKQSPAFVQAIANLCCCHIQWKRMGIHSGVLESLIC